MPDRYASLKQGLVGAWIPSISGSGLLLPDLSGYGNNGQLTNMDTSDWVSSQYGRALDFDGVNDWVSVEHRGILAFPVSNGSAFTAFINPSTVAGGTTFSTANPRYVLIKNEALGDANYGLRLLGGTIDFLYRNASDNGFVEIRTDAEVIPANQFSHICAVHASNAIRLYCNGVEVPSTLVSGSATDSGSGQSTSQRLFIGTEGIAGTRWFTGALDDIRIYNRALTEPEIRLLASKRGIGLEPRKPKLLFHQFPSGAKRRLLLTGQT